MLYYKLAVDHEQVDCCLAVCGIIGFIAGGIGGASCSAACPAGCQFIVMCVGALVGSFFGVGLPLATLDCVCKMFKVVRR